MAAPQRRTVKRKVVLKQRPLNFYTLQMMVQSGVVRRADFDPPTFGSRTRFHVLDDIDHGSATEAIAEQGWLARIILGRRSQASLSNRPAEKRG